jgi:hypothetical protein
MKGNGSSLSPYEISTASDLQAMQEDLSANYIVVNDIDASGTVNWNNGQGFNPIGHKGDNAVRFTGSLDGKKYDISGLNIKRQSENNVGLFGAIGAGAEVENVGVINVNINGNNQVGSLVGRNYDGTVSNSYSTGNVTGTYFVGGLVGKNYKVSTISNSYSTGNVTGNKWVGGLVGRNSKGTVSNSYSTGNVTGEPKFVGGLVGHNYNGNISNSYSTGNVQGIGVVGGLVGLSEGTVSNSYSTGNVTGTYKVGGLVGQNYGGTVSISNSYSTGNVTGESYDVGGLVGDNYYGNISNSYSTGNVTGGESNNVGGLVGINYGTVSNSYSTGNVSGNKKVGGLVGYNDEGNISDSYSTGNVTGANDVGGLIGKSDSGSVVSDSYWDIESTGQSSSAGLPDSNGLTTSEMQGSSASSNMNFEFTSTWSTVTGDYPELQWQE